MITEQQAYDILADKIKKHKDHANVSMKRKSGRPEYYEGYNKVCDEYESIRVHSVAGVIPEKLFAKRSPNATEQEWNYAKDNYQQTSNLPVFMDFVSTVSRAFNDGNWSVEYKKDNTNIESYQEYVEGEVPTYYSVENYIRHVLPANKMRDAMGVTVVKPKISYKLDGSGEYLIEDDQELRKPEIFYFECPHVWSNEDEEYFVIKTNRYCKCDDGKEGFIIWVVDDVNFYVFHQTGKQADWSFVLKETIPHNSDTIPVQRLKGVPVIHDNHLFWQSQFLFAVPALNSVVLDESYLQISKYKVGYPTRIIAANICEFVDAKTQDNCINGYLGIPGSELYRKCPACDGTGSRTRLSPQAELLLKPGTRENNYQSEDVDKVLKYVSPPVEAMDLLRREISTQLYQARAILHLKSEGTPDSGENVVESANQNKSLNAFIKPISDQMFSLYEWILEVMAAQIYPENPPEVTVIFPQSFEFLTDKDYLFLIKEAQASGAPPFVIHALIWKYLSSIFYTDMEAAKVADLIMKTDRLVTLTTNEIQQGILNKTIEPWEKILHDSAIQFVMELQSEASFWKDNTDRVTLLINKAKEKSDIIKAASNTGTGVPAFNQPAI